MFLLMVLTADNQCSQRNCYKDMALEFEYCTFPLQLQFSVILFVLLNFQFPLLGLMFCLTHDKFYTKFLFFTKRCSLCTTVFRKCRIIETNITFHISNFFFFSFSLGKVKSAIFVDLTSTEIATPSNCSIYFFHL